MKQNNREKKSITNIGTSLMIVILIGLSFIVIAALAISSSKNNYDLTMKYDKHTQEYYAASNEAYEKIAMNNWDDDTFSVPIDDNQVLDVSVKGKKIVKWKVTTVSNWEFDDSLPVFQGDF